MSEIYLNILGNKRLKVFKQLGFTNELKMYLAGGTALALQIGHRTSVDFDFYTQKKLNILKYKFNSKSSFLRECFC